MRLGLYPRVQVTLRTEGSKATIFADKESLLENRPCLTIDHYNVSFWGDAVEARLEHTKADVVCYCETLD